MTPLAIALLGLIASGPPAGGPAPQGAVTSTPAPPQATPLPVEPNALHGTYWRLTHLGETRVSFTPGAREPHLVFQPSGSVTGADGCNTIRGGYRLDGDSLTFAPFMGTLMACPGLEKLDRRFLEALGATRTWRVSNTTLTFLDEAQAAVARFDAVPR